MNALFITEIEPFPPDRGERIRSYNLINSLLQFTDRLILVAGNAPPDEQKYNKVEYHEYPGKRTRNRWFDLIYLFRRKRKVVRLLRRILSENGLDLVFIDYDFLGHYIRMFKKRGIRVVYGTHNVQSYLNFQRPISGLRNRLFFQLKFMLERHHENSYFRRADLLIAVSELDLEYYNQRMDHGSAHLIPNYIDENDYSGYKSRKKDQLIMTGNFNAFQNHAGLQWFLENVWNSELAKLAELVIAGHGSEEHVERLRMQGVMTERVRVLGSVDNLKGHITESRAAIIPLLHGSGTRLKCIEAMALKTNIVSTSVGAEGIRHNGSILIADSADEFKAGLLRVLHGEIRNEERAFQVFMEEYSSRSNTPRLKAILGA